MCACSRVFEQSEIEIYLWKDRVISSILNEISIVFLKKEFWKKKIRAEAKDWNF